MHYLKNLGSEFKALRKKKYPKDNLAMFAVRIGVSRATLQKMEKGDMSVSLGKYYKAAQLLGVQDNFINLFFVEKSLFDV